VTSEKHCPECREPLRSIQLLDATAPGVGHKGVHHTRLAYASSGAEPGLPMGAVPKEGHVRAFICDQCGRILLYGGKA